MPIDPQNGDLTAGIASSYTETINANPDPLVTGDNPAVATTDENIAASQDLDALTVVGFDGSGRIIPAVEGTTAAIGVLAYAISTDVSTDLYAEVYRMGVFNPDLLVWDASYSTDELKRAAFEGAPTPTSIIIRKPTTKTVS